MHVVVVGPVMNYRENLAASNAQKLKSKTSIVDLLKLLELDSSLAARKELANELGCPLETQADWAKMNMKGGAGCRLCRFWRCDSRGSDVAPAHIGP